MKTKPFNSEALQLVINNDGDYWKEARRLTVLLRMFIDRVAKKQAKANADWHDDPESEDHADYHAPAEDQFPRGVRDKTILATVAHHLRILNEDDSVTK